MSSIAGRGLGLTIHKLYIYSNAGSLLINSFIYLRQF